MEVQRIPDSKIWDAEEGLPSSFGDTAMTHSEEKRSPFTSARAALTEVGLVGIREDTRFPWGLVVLETAFLSVDFTGLSPALPQLCAPIVRRVCVKAG
ncbi:hypothetical protein EYF80_020434 [Liparis tanakae]|uniref:Uncharacterized protein n=1 Tax=Liparis tanakae TaxID=230148 RepID=A0A4Z2HWD1_9TELE|nr:hypothetical protein EYF80_020434 [Liparis tanakae]